MAKSGNAKGLVSFDRDDADADADAGADEIIDRFRHKKLNANADGERLAVERDER